VKNYLKGACSVRVNDQFLRDSIIRSLRAEPLFVEGEEALHSIDVAARSEKFREGLLQSLKTAPLQAEADHMPYRDVEEERVQKFREALLDALKSGTSVTEAEREVLTSIGFEKLGEFRSRVQTHLGGPAEIPDEDLAIYVPAGEGRRQSFRDAIEEQIRELGIEPKIPIDAEEITPEEPIEAAIRAEIEDLLSEEDALAPWDPFVAPTPVEEEILPQATVDVTVPSEEGAELIYAAMEGEPITVLNPVPMMTAALEAAGVEGDDFGFLLRYGRYAPEGRKSEFLVGGMGLAELSDRLAAWLKANGPMESQVQVVDEGSGELMIYLLGKEI
jgi:hypothetical protein